MKGYLLVSLLYFISLLQASLQNACYRPECQHGELLRDCIHGQWQCHITQFCEIKIHDHVSTQCREGGGHDQWQKCTTKEDLNPSSCDPHALSSADCTYCCHNETCIQQLVTASEKHCFTNQCGGHSVDLTDCLGHAWTCDSDEYCEVITHSADLTSSHCIGTPGIGGDASRWQMQCLPIQENHPNARHRSLDACRELSDKCSLGCDPSSHAHACIWCPTSLQEFESGVRNTTSSLLSTTSSTGQPAQSSTTHAVSSQPSTAEETAATTTAATTGTTAAPTTAASTTAAPSTAALTTAASTTAAPSTAAPSTAALTTAASTTAASSTAAPPTAACVQCGDYDNDVPCTDEETLDDTQTSCTGGGAYCMTHALVDTAKTTSIYKRCVNETVCRTMWYEQTSDNPICLSFDLTGVTSDLACHFCCRGEGCNVNILPAKDTLFVPVG